MCEVYDKTTTPKGGYVAENDIVCYKVLITDGNKGVYKSPVMRSSEWEIGKEHTSRIVTRLSEVYESQTVYVDGLIGWLKSQYYFPIRGDEYDESLIRKKRILPVPDIGQTTDGLYSFTRYRNMRMEALVKSMYLPSSLFKFDSIVIARCRIPAGSRYYVSECGSVFVSDRLVMDTVIRTFEKGTCPAWLRELEYYK